MGTTEIRRHLSNVESRHVKTFLDNRNQPQRSVSSSKKQWRLSLSCFFGLQRAMSKHIASLPIFGCQKSHSYPILVAQ
jgi:hypothetical protein